MSLEGNLRDLALPEICQLLAHTRKSGELRIKAPLAGLNASILFDSGAIVGAEIDGMSARPHVRVDAHDAAQAVESTTLELLCWNEGQFRFVSSAVVGATPDTGVRLHTELLLMEGARRSEEWERLSDRIPNARAVPAFADVEPRQLPLLNLQPQQWEVLTGVDGVRDLSLLAQALGRDLLEVAGIVHGLIGTGMLKLMEVSRVLRTQATPPSIAAQSHDDGADLWVPTVRDSDEESADNDADDDIFDPVRIGVITPEGLPCLRIPSPVDIGTSARVMVTNVAVARATASRPTAAWVASKRLRSDRSAPVIGDAESLRGRGDAAARRGDLAEALYYWNALRVTSEAGLSDTVASDTVASGQARVAHAYAIAAIDAATRLQQLLHVTHGAN